MKGANVALKQAEDLDQNETGDEENVATGYEIAICMPENEMRILMRNELGEVVSSYVCDADHAYEMGMKILKGYDKLEGIK